MSEGERLEQLLRSALVPVEPPEALSDRLERSLSGLTEAAAEELADSTWPRCATRATGPAPPPPSVVGSMAGGALVLVRARQRQRKRESSGLRALEKGVRDAGGRPREAPRGS